MRSCDGSGLGLDVAVNFDQPAIFYLMIFNSLHNWYLRKSCIRNLVLLPCSFRIARIRQIKVLLMKLRNSGDGRKVGGRRRGAKNFQTVLQPLNYRYSKGDWNDCLLAHRFYIHWFGSSELSLNEFNVVSKMEELRFCDRVGLYSDVILQYR